MTTYRIQVSVNMTFILERDARSEDAAMRSVERDLSAQAADRNNPLNGFTICSAEALPSADKWPGCPADLVRA